MPWTETTRRQYQRDGLRYASDLTDAEWAVIAPLMPKPAAVGRPRTTDLRQVVEAMLYMASTGCQWRQLPNSGLMKSALSRVTTLANAMQPIVGFSVAAYPFRALPRGPILDQRLWAETAQHEADHGEADEHCRLASVTLVIAGELTTTADPCEGAPSGRAKPPFMEWPAPLLHHNRVAIGG